VAGRVTRQTRELDSQRPTPREVAYPPTPPPVSTTILVSSCERYYAYREQSLMQLNPNLPLPPFPSISRWRLCPRREIRISQARARRKVSPLVRKGGGRREGTERYEAGSCRVCESIFGTQLSSLPRRHSERGRCAPLGSLFPAWPPAT